jgi:hypothetical protein
MGFMAYSLGIDLDDYYLLSRIIYKPVLFFLIHGIDPRIPFPLFIKWLDKMGVGENLTPLP